MPRLGQRKGNKIIKCGDYSKILIKSKGTIFECLIDTEDIEKLSKYTWGVHYEKRMNSYYCECGKTKGISSS